MFPIRTILAPTDFSSPSLSAVELAACLANDSGARLIVLEVRGDSGSGGEAQAVARDRLGRLCASVAASGPVEGRAATGDPVEEVLREAREVRADLIVLGSLRRKPSDRPGTVVMSERITQGAQCPVLSLQFPTSGAAEDRMECGCGRPLAQSAGDVIVLYESCPCTGRASALVHHRGFPEVIGEGSTVAEGADQLVRHLIRARDHARGPWHLDPIDHALEDVALFIRGLPLEEAPPAPATFRAYAPPPLIEAIP